MRKRTNIRSHSSGQALLIAVVLIAALLIGVSAVFFSNQIGTFHQTASAQRSKSRSVAEEGISYAAQELSASSTTWHHALNGDFSNTACNTGSDISSPSGGLFRLSCSTGTTGNPNLQAYEVAVVSVALSSASANGLEAPLRAMQAYFSQRTLGTDLATGIHTGAALQMVTQPDPSTSLNVHWGPMVCLDTSNPWVISDPLDSQRYPRKFSVAGIIGTAFPRSASGSATDQKEYWAQASQSFVPIVDDSYYQTLAQNTDVASPTSKLAAPIQRNCPILGHPNCGYFTPGGDTYIFDAASPGFTLSGGVEGAAIYVDGSAEFTRVAIDSAAVVVTGSLTLNDPVGSGNSSDLHVPVTASLEYPYSPATPATWPCQGQLGDTLPSGMPQYDCHYDQVFSGKVQFRGFLYVKGYLLLNTASWNMVGSLLVGDMQATATNNWRISLAPGAAAGDSLNLAYDDGINHSIHVYPISGASIKLGLDKLQDIASF